MTLLLANERITTPTIVTVGVNNDGIVLVMGSFMNKLAVLSTKTKKPKKIAGFNGFLVSGIVSLVS